ncbi:helix-turn-helix transcriptional regulator [Paenibacillus sp. JJ-223]|uniref:helix-turn-helix domain-containing protein n=1 Tax=Paenibacillus sp. JJ-223 TaxID=2905647 RepID=UPI001F19FC08|nr:helix-turn-helix transcriptional regulator [Paenibacillus sp. JJ-223]
MSVSGERIKKLREEKGLSQLEFAERIGMSNSVLSRIESGKRPLEDEEINLFADFFEVSGDYILGRSISKTPSGGSAYMDGGKGWTEEEKEVANAAIQAWREMKRKQMEKNNQ